MRTFSLLRVEALWLRLPRASVLRDPAAPILGRAALPAGLEPEEQEAEVDIGRRRQEPDEARELLAVAAVERLEAAVDALEVAGDHAEDERLPARPTPLPTRGSRQPALDVHARRGTRCADLHMRFRSSFPKGSCGRRHLGSASN